MTKTNQKSNCILKHLRKSRTLKQRLVDAIPYQVRSVITDWFQLVTSQDEKEMVFCQIHFYRAIARHKSYSYPVWDDLGKPSLVEGIFSRNT